MTSSAAAPRPRRRGLVAGGEDGRQVSRPERPRQPRPRSATVRRVAGEDPARGAAGWWQVARTVAKSAAPNGRASPGRARRRSVG